MGKQRRAIPDLSASMKKKAPVPSSPKMTAEEQAAVDLALKLSREDIRPGRNENAFVGSGSGLASSAAANSALIVKETRTTTSSKSKVGKDVPISKKPGDAGSNLAKKRSADDTGRGKHHKRPRVVDQRFSIEYPERDLPLLNNPVGCGQICRELRDRKENFPELGDLAEGEAYFDMSQKMCAVRYFYSLL